MSDYVEIYALRVNSAQRPTNPKHWVVMVKQRGRKAWEFKRGGLLDGDTAIIWCKSLTMDYEDAIEVYAYELSKAEYAKRFHS